MTPLTLLAILLILSSFAYYLGRKRAFSVAGGGGVKNLYSRPTYYGTLIALWCGIPAIILFGLWLSFESNIITFLVINDLHDEIRNLPEDRLTLVINDIKNIVYGNIVSGKVDSAMQKAADHYRSLKTTSILALAVVSITISIVGIITSLNKITPRLRARNHVERVIIYILIVCSTIAMLVAVPIGLMSAIYLSEYANKKFRTIVKPLMEILAGIPTVVYGFFTALTMLRILLKW